LLHLATLLPIGLGLTGWDVDRWGAATWWRWRCRCWRCCIQRCEGWSEVELRKQLLTRSGCVVQIAQHIDGGYW